MRYRLPHTRRTLVFPNSREKFDISRIFSLKNKNTRVSDIDFTTMVLGVFQIELLDAPNMTNDSGSKHDDSAAK